MDTPMTHEQSLRLIESMMSQAKRSFSRMSFYFLTWGILLTLAMLGTHVWSGVDPGIRYGAPWGVAGVVGGALSMWYGARQSRKEEVLNPMDRIINWLWASFVIALLLVGYLVTLAAIASVILLWWGGTHAATELLSLTGLTSSR